MAYVPNKIRASNQENAVAVMEKKALEYVNANGAPLTKGFIKALVKEIEAFFEPLTKEEKSQLVEDLWLIGKDRKIKDETDEIYAYSFAVGFFNVMMNPWYFKLKGDVVVESNN